MAEGPKPEPTLARSRILPLLLLAVVLVAAGAVALMGRDGASAPPSRPIGLFTSLPILWRETDNLGELLSTDAPPHWALGVIGAHGRLQPVDTLAGRDGKLPLPADALLILAQPRPLSPAENVALDDWVRRGGHILLFADPMLTSHSAFALGDRRRPQDIALLSPILGRWNLELQFDDRQPFGERQAAVLGASMPVNLAGRFVTRNAHACKIEADGLAARCRVGAGDVLAIADAALLENGTSGDERYRAAALAHLLARIAL